MADTLHGEGGLPEGDLFQLEEICFRFDTELQAGKRPDMERYLREVAEPRRPALRRMLDAIESEFLGRAGGRPGRTASRSERSRSTSEDSDAVQGTEDTTPLGPTAATDRGPRPERIGRYRVEKTLGEGAFGTVYLAYDEDLRRAVAVKVPHRGRVVRTEDVELYLREAQVVARLDHPAIVPVYDVGRMADGQCYVVSKYIEGEDLKTRIGRQRPSHAESAELVATVAEGLHHAHLKRIVHRDVKPANILLDSRGRPFIADFGLALREESFGRGPESVGTPAYMSPEQVLGEGHLVDGRSDIFSLGVVLYELLTGSRPFVGRTMAEVIERIKTLEARPPRQLDDSIPKELEQICLKALAKDVKDRYRTAADLAQDLRRWLAPKRRRTIGLGIAALVLLLVIAGALVASWGKRERQPAPELRGTVDVVIYDPANAARHGRRLREAGALPLRAGDQIRVEAMLNRPGFVYLVWLPSEGGSAPVYPWQPGQWQPRPEEDSPTEQIALPRQLNRGWTVKGKAGMETFLLLARDTPLPNDVDLQALLRGLDLPPGRYPAALVEFENGSAVTKEVDARRGVDFSELGEIKDEVLELQQRIVERLGPHFRYIRAVSFTYQGQ